MDSVKCEEMKLRKTSSASKKTRRDAGLCDHGGVVGCRGCPRGEIQLLAVLRGAPKHQGAPDSKFEVIPPKTRLVQQMFHDFQESRLAGLGQQLRPGRLQRLRESIRSSRGR